MANFALETGFARASAKIFQKSVDGNFSVPIMRTSSLTGSLSGSPIFKKANEQPTSVGAWFLGVFAFSGARGRL
jgi:hypothetical protein